MSFFSKIVSFESSAFSIVRYSDSSIKCFTQNHPLIATIATIALLVFSLKAAVSGYLACAALSGYLAFTVVIKFRSAPKDFFMLVKHCLAVQYYSFKIWMLI